MFDLIYKRKRLAQIILALLIIPFAFFGLESYTRSIGGKDDVATVDGVGITQREFAEALREQQDRLRAAFGKNIDAGTFDTPEARAVLVNSLVRQQLVYQEAVRSHLVVSKEMFDEVVAGVPAFQRDGRFDPETAKAVLRAQGMGEEQFAAMLRRDMTVGQLSGVVAGTAIASKAVTERLAALEGQRREVQEALIAAQPHRAQVRLTEAQLRAHYDANPAEFRVPERVLAEFVVLSADALGKQEPVSEGEIKAAYDARASQYKVEEQRRASHILVKTQAEAENLAAEARKNPGRFAELARQHSQDTGSAAKGGDLGQFGRGMMVPAFEEAAFRQKEGEIGAPVQSEFGWHVIRVTGVQAATVRPLADVRAELAADLVRQKGARRFAEAAENFSNLVYEQADSLKPAAERYGLAVQASGWIGRTPAPEAGVMAHPRLLGALFAAESIKTRRNTEAVEVSPGVLVAARVLDHQPESQKRFEDVRAAIEQALRAAEAAKLAQKEGEAKLEQLRKGGDAGVKWGPVKAVSRRSPQGVPAGALRQIMAAEAAKLPAYAGAEHGAEGYMLYRVGRVLQSELRPEQDKAAGYARASQAAGAEQLEAYVASLRARADVVIHSSNLEKKP